MVAFGDLLVEWLYGGFWSPAKLEINTLGFEV